MSTVNKKNSVPPAPVTPEKLATPKRGQAMKSTLSFKEEDNKVESKRGDGVRSSRSVEDKCTFRSSISFEEKDDPSARRGSGLRSSRSVGEQSVLKSNVSFGEKPEEKKKVDKK
jgi:hypothetical protein